MLTNLSRNRKLHGALGVLIAAASLSASNANAEQVILPRLHPVSMTLPKAEPTPTHAERAAIGHHMIIFVDTPLRQAIYGALQKPTQASDESIEEQIKRMAKIYHEWNPLTPVIEIQRILHRDVATLGVNQGLLAPAVAFVDMAIFHGRDSFAEALAPEIAALNPEIGEVLASGIGLPRHAQPGAIEGLGEIRGIARRGLEGINSRLGVDSIDDIFMGEGSMDLFDGTSGGYDDSQRAGRMPGGSPIMGRAEKYIRGDDVGGFGEGFGNGFDDGRGGMPSRGDRDDSDGGYGGARGGFDDGRGGMPSRGDRDDSSGGYDPRRGRGGMPGRGDSVTNPGRGNREDSGRGGRRGPRQGGGAMPGRGDDVTNPGRGGMDAHGVDDNGPGRTRAQCYTKCGGEALIGVGATVGAAAVSGPGAVAVGAGTAILGIVCARSCMDVPESKGPKGGSGGGGGTPSGGSDGGGSPPPANNTGGGGTPPPNDSGGSGGGTPPPSSPPPKDPPADPPPKNDPPSNPPPKDNGGGGGSGGGDGCTTSACKDDKGRAINDENGGGVADDGPRVRIGGNIERGSGAGSIRSNPIMIPVIKFGADDARTGSFRK